MIYSRGDAKEGSHVGRPLDVGQAAGHAADE